MTEGFTRVGSILLKIRSLRHSNRRNLLSFHPLNIIYNLTSRAHLNSETQQEGQIESCGLTLVSVRDIQ